MWTFDVLRRGLAAAFGGDPGAAPARAVFVNRKLLFYFTGLQDMKYEKNVKSDGSELTW